MKGPPRSNDSKSINDMQGVIGVKKKDYSLPAGYIPGDDDVICGRSKDCMDHTGNLRFRVRVKDKLDRYASASNKAEKSAIIMETIHEVRDKSPFGGFIRRDNKTGKYFQAGDYIAREKTSQAFRDAISDRYKSSRETRKRKRDEEKLTSLESTEQTTNLPSNLRSDPLESESINRHLPFVASQQPYTQHSALTDVPTYNQNMLYSDSIRTNMQQQLQQQHHQQTIASTNVDQTVADSDLLYADFLPITSQPKFQMPSNDLDIVRQLRQDTVSDVEDINLGQLNQQQRHTVLLQQQLQASQLNAFQPNIHHHQIQQHQFHPPESHQQQRSQLAFDPSFAAASAAPYNNNNNDDDDFNHNMSYRSQIPTYPEFSTFTLDSLEPRPIGENPTKKEDSPPEDSKPPAKKRFF